MHRTLLPIVAGCVAAFVFAVPKPASATTAAAPAVHYGETNAGMVQEVRRRYYRGRRYVRPYAYGYGYRPYYRPPTAIIGLMPITVPPMVITVGRTVIGVVPE